MSKTFDEHLIKMDKEHPDWLKKGATSHLAVAQEFWNAGRASTLCGRFTARVRDLETRFTRWLYHALGPHSTPR